MKESENSFQSVYEYLDVVFKDCDPSNQQIKEAKQAYRKLYQEAYQKIYQEKNIQVTFRLTKNQYEEIQSKSEKQNLKVTTFIKQRAVNEKDFNSSPIKQIIRNLIDDVEESIYEKQPIKVDVVLSQLENLQRFL
ncbi:plasmid mobilization protein [Polaribacter sp.]|uniref:plasmid mobilization protein n=1 Tax=Polaribacter sp. TaxID=1920175 RepID=UPI003F6BF92D